jgi:hypothetical protein
MSYCTRYRRAAAAADGSYAVSCIRRRRGASRYRASITFWGMDFLGVVSFSSYQHLIRLLFFSFRVSWILWPPNQIGGIKNNKMKRKKGGSNTRR